MSKKDDLSQEYMCIKACFHKRKYYRIGDRCIRGQLAKDFDKDKFVPVVRKKEEEIILDETKLEEPDGGSKGKGSKDKSGGRIAGGVF